MRTSSSGLLLDGFQARRALACLAGVRVIGRADPVRKRRSLVVSAALTLLGLHVDGPLEAGAVLQDHARRRDVAADRAGLPQDRLLLGEDVAVHLALDRH